MQCFTSCWRLVDWQKDLAIRVSSILMELCELEVFLLSWPVRSQSSSPGSSPGKYSSCRSRSCPCPCIGGHFFWIDWYVNKMRSCLFILETVKPLKMILDSAMASTMKNIYHKKTLLFYPEDGFHPKKTSWSLGGNKPFHTAKVSRTCNGEVGR